VIEAAKQLIQQEIFNASNAHGEPPPQSPHRVVNGAVFLVNLGRRCTHASFQWAVHELVESGLLRIRAAERPQYISDCGGHGFAVGGETSYRKDPTEYVSLGLYVLETTDQLFYGEEGPPNRHEPALQPIPEWTPGPDQLPSRTPDGYRGQLLFDVRTVEEFVIWINHTLHVYGLVCEGRGDRTSNGDLIHNAYLLADKIGLRGIGDQPAGPFKMDDELRSLRDIRRRVTEQTGIHTEAITPVGPEEGRADRGGSRTGKASANVVSDEPPQVAATVRPISDKPNVGPPRRGDDQTRCSPNAGLALRQALYALRENSEWSERHPDRAIHDWLVSHEVDLPDDLKPVQRNFDTWARYLRAGRRLTGTQKNSPRHGRTSRSIVESSEI
jgi:hypothetical protein